MAEAFVRTIKRDYVHVNPCSDAQTIMHQLSAWINHYNVESDSRASGNRQRVKISGTRYNPLPKPVKRIWNINAKATPE